MGILETHLREEDGSRKVSFPEGYMKVEVRRSDLDDDKNGGGIMVLYKRAQGVRIEEKKLKIRGQENQFVKNERVWMSIKTKTDKLAVGFVYVAAENRSEKNKEKFDRWNDSIYTVLEDDMKKLRREGYVIVLNGDLNGWVGCGRGGIPGNRPEVNSNGVRLMNFLERTGMIHLNGTAKCTGLYTRHSSNSATVLDYVAVRKEDLPMVKSMFIDENSTLGGNSDHVYVITTLEQTYSAGPAATTKTRLATRWNMDEATDWEKFRQCQQRMVGEVPEGAWDSVEPLGEILKEVLVGSMEEGVGKKEAKDSRPKQYPPGVRKEFRKMKEMRSEWRTARSKMTKNPSQQNKQVLGEKHLKMQQQQNRMDDVLSRFWREKRVTVNEKLTGGGAASSKLFWSYVVKKTRGSQPFPFLEDPETGEIKSEQKEVKEIVENFLKKLFQGSFTPNLSRPATEEDIVNEPMDQESEDSAGDVDEPSPRERVDKRLEQEFDEREVQNMIRELKNGKAAGVDTIPNEALKNSVPEFVSALVVLFNNIRKEGKAPEAWKVGRLVLVHKKGSLTDMGNYRPLTVLASMSGLFSRVLNQRLTEVVEDRCILGEVQQGFRKNRRGADNTFILNTIIMKGTATKKRPHLAYLDIKKAYDSVSRQNLWIKMEALGLGGSFVDMIKALYTGDRIRAEVNGEPTREVYLQRGLRQGCSLSPMLFAIYVVGWGEALENSGEGVKLGNILVPALFFADDVVLIASSVEGLKRLMSISEDETQKMGLTISESKSKVVSVNDEVSWSLHNNEGEIMSTLEKVMDYKYLGLETHANIRKTTTAKHKKMVTAARRYRGACKYLSR